MPQRIHSTGSLDTFNPILVTPVIGTEFPKDSCNIVDDILNAPNAEQRIRDLALILQMGHLTTRPPSHGLHIHPVTNDSREFGDPDPQISTINSEGRKKLYKGSDYTRMAAVWHSDIAFEKAPADFSSLRLTQLPVTGGDTLWASGYEVYDRISKPYRAFLEGLSATHVGEGFKRMGVKVYEGERGAPVNVGDELEAVHPVVRTNPITGWKSVFPIGAFPTKINELNRKESANMLQYFHDLITYGHDLQVRFKWNEPNDIAIWDNRSVFHTATGDHEGFGPRSGNRAVGVGEVPYFDPESKSRREDLGIEDTLSPAHL
ncbi:alpha-ketoglutarate-dependent sulfonate dioxygenase [Aspergillus eucalypticola CBS 122712]|uniref:Alpha-ketoglutarate-dependent sulfonate dioxygenase n=1 Tax=Aspergillus eucalypticola (strain CBS 122712 / IBT 29274) TaxID=1448314 RepID=A0A317UMZ6_ASPEC|nr:alpha-ketoglutarate-dependent sulfonate dioxygenase [Aspergillus eucalypticola CBS 122712]PWY61937.1 alpha-ketoglutarate-dependent sulfonate dioxygenase [Aspergillus eucalypticola CBS 122712]